MRLPIGYGSVQKLSGKRRKPFAVRVTVGWTDEGKQIKETIATVKSRKEGYQKLADYHNKPYAVDTNKLTFKYLYERWLPTKEKELTHSGLKHYTNAYKYYEKLYNVPFNDITANDLQTVINECNKGYAVRSKIKSLYSQLYKYAGLIGMNIKNNASEFVSLGKQEETVKRIVFSKTEILKLWNSRNNNVDLILLLLYTGLRPNELFKISEIHDTYFVTGSKTEAGKNRIIPLNNKIKDIFKNIVDNNLIPKNYDQLHRIFSDEMKRLNMNHTLYETRHTFATILNEKKANPICVKLIMGHKIKDITAGIYTHKNLDDLIDTINLLD